MYLIKWEMNNEVVTKEIVALNLIERINELCKGLTGERIIIYINNKTIIKNIVQIKIKLSQYIVDYGVICSRIKEKFKMIRVEVVVEYSRQRPKINEDYKEN